MVMLIKANELHLEKREPSKISKMLGTTRNAMFIHSHHRVLSGHVAPLWVKLPGKFDSYSLAKTFEAGLDAKWFPLIKVRTHFSSTFQINPRELPFVRHTTALLTQSVT